jgi:hypothetical protein
VAVFVAHNNSSFRSIFRQAKKLGSTDSASCVKRLVRMPRYGSQGEFAYCVHDDTDLIAR